MIGGLKIQNSLNLYTHIYIYIYHGVALYIHMLFLVSNSTTLFWKNKNHFDARISKKPNVCSWTTARWVALAKGLTLTSKGKDYFSIWGYQYRGTQCATWLGAQYGRIVVAGLHTNCCTVSQGLKKHDIAWPWMVIPVFSAGQNATLSHALCGIPQSEVGRRWGVSL